MWKYLACASCAYFFVQPEMMNANDEFAKDVVMEEKKKEEDEEKEEETDAGGLPTLQLPPAVLEEEKKKKLVLKYTTSIVVGREPDVNGLNYKFVHSFKKKEASKKNLKTISKKKPRISNRKFLKQKLYQRYGDDTREALEEQIKGIFCEIEGKLQSAAEQPDYFVSALRNLVNKLYLLMMSIPCTNQTLEDVVVMMLEEKGKSIEEDVADLYTVLGTFEETAQRCLLYVRRANEAALAAGQKMEAETEMQKSLAEFTETEIQANLKKTAESVVKQINREAEDMRQ